MTASRAVREVVLHPGDFYFGGGTVRIRTLLGSCVSITMWHPQKRIGGMCHYVSPKRSKPHCHGDALDGRYANEAMEMFMRELRGRRTPADQYVVKLFGGGKMFQTRGADKLCGANKCGERERESCPDVACRNVALAHRWLAEQRCAIAAEHVGGIGYRQLVFELWTGDVWLRRGSPLPNAGRKRA